MLRREILTGTAVVLLSPSALAQHGVGVDVKLQIDAGTLGAIPGNERSKLVVRRDDSQQANTLASRIPADKAVLAA